MKPYKSDTERPTPSTSKADPMADERFPETVADAAAEMTTLLVLGRGEYQMVLTNPTRRTVQPHIIDFGKVRTYPLILLTSTLRLLKNLSGN